MKKNKPILYDPQIINRVKQVSPKSENTNEKVRVSSNVKAKH